MKKKISKVILREQISLDELVNKKAQKWILGGYGGVSGNCPYYCSIVFNNGTGIDFDCCLGSLGECQDYVQMVAYYYHIQDDVCGTSCGNY